MGVSFARNICHGSDSVESAEKEIALWFRPEELVEWKPTEQQWIYEWILLAFQLEWISHDCRVLLLRACYSIKWSEWAGLQLSRYMYTDSDATWPLFKWRRTFRARRCNPRSAGRYCPAVRAPPGEYVHEKKTVLDTVASHDSRRC